MLGQHPTPPVTLAELAQALPDAQLFGEGSFAVHQLMHPLMAQAETDLVLILDPQALPLLQHPHIQAAVVAEGIPIPDGALKGYVTVKRPRFAMAALMEIFEKPVHAKPGIHPTAVIEPTAQVAPDVSIGAFVYVGEQAVIGPKTTLMPHVTIGAEAKVGAECLLHPGVRIGERVMIGNHVIIQHNASIGADGFSYVTPEPGSIESARSSGGKVEAQNTQIFRINSIGTVILEDNVEVGACATIDRATLGATLIKKGTKIDNLVMIGHNNTVGENCLIVSQVGISGSCKIGNRVVIAGQAGIADHLKVGDDAIVMAQSGVMRDIEAKTVVVSTPAVPQREAFQQFAYLGKMRDMHKELRELRKRLEALEKQTEKIEEPAHR